MRSRRIERGSRAPSWFASPSVARWLPAGASRRGSSGARERRGSDGSRASCRRWATTSFRGPSDRGRATGGSSLAGSCRRRRWRASRRRRASPSGCRPPRRRTPRRALGDEKDRIAGGPRSTMPLDHLGQQIERLTRRLAALEDEANEIGSVESFIVRVIRESTVPRSATEERAVFVAAMREAPRSGRLHAQDGGGLSNLGKPSAGMVDEFAGRMFASRQVPESGAVVAELVESDERRSVAGGFADRHCHVASHCRVSAG